MQNITRALFLFLPMTSKLVVWLWHPDSCKSVCLFRQLRALTPKGQSRAARHGVSCTIWTPSAAIKTCVWVAAVDPDDVRRRTTNQRREGTQVCAEAVGCPPLGTHVAGKRHPHFAAPCSSCEASGNARDILAATNSKLHPWPPKRPSAGGQGQGGFSHD